MDDRFEWFRSAILVCAKCAAALETVSYREGRSGCCFCVDALLDAACFIACFVCLLRGLYGMVVWVVPHVCAVADVQVYLIAVARQLFHLEVVLKVISWSGSSGYFQICRKHLCTGTWELTSESSCGCVCY